MQQTELIDLDPNEYQIAFVHASGPGGQNVNKVSTAVHLRFDVRASPSLPEALKERLTRLAGRRMTEDGVLVIEARRFRTQEANRQDALRRLNDLLERASEVTPARKPTRPTKASQRQRLEKKKRLGDLKRSRGKAIPRCDE